MSPDLDRILCERYPKIFARRDDSTSAMAWGLCCGPGWAALIDALCAQLQHETDVNGAPQVVATQVKEKFGELRFTTREANEAQRRLIKAARTLSSHTCEVCGAPATEKDTDLDWIYTRCAAHEPGLTAEQHAAMEAISAAYDRYLVETLRAPGARLGLQSMMREPPDLDGRVIAGVPESTPALLQTYVDEEFAKRALKRL